MQLKFAQKKCCDVCGALKEVEHSYNVLYENKNSKTVEQLTYIKCKCGNTYCLTPPTSSSIKYIYSPSWAEYYSFSEDIGLISKLFRDAVLKRKFSQYVKYLRSSERTRVIDVGCGDGALLFVAQKKYGDRHYFAAQDLFDGNQQSFESKGIIFHSGRVEDLQIKEKFDLVICNQVIEHSLNPDAFLDGLRSLGHSQTIFVFETPNSDCIDLNIFKAHWGGFHAPQHINVFSPTSIKMLLNLKGFKVLHVQQITATWAWCSAVKSFRFIGLGGLWSILGSLKNPISLSLFTAIDLVRIWSGLQTSNMRIVAKLNFDLEDSIKNESS